MQDEHRGTAVAPRDLRRAPSQRAR